MKTKITYLLSPQTIFSRFPIASRILTTILEREKRFDVQYPSGLALITYAKGMKKLKEEYYPILDSLDTSYGAYARMWCGERFPIFYSFTGIYDKEILEAIPTEIVFFTAYTVLDFRLVKVMLEDNRKVLMGGTSCMVYKPYQIRDFLVQMGTDKDLVDKNLVIVNGYADLTTDLYSIFEKWEDTEITENKLSTIWDCYEDSFLEHLSIYKSMFFAGLGGILSTGCWWKKCKFCTWLYLPTVNFTEGVPTDKIVNHFKILSEKYQSMDVDFCDNYMMDTSYNRELFKKLSDEGFRIKVFTGVLSSKNEKYLNFINETKIHKICLGLEGSNDFSLNYLNKGYGKKEIDEMVEAYKKHLNRSTRTSFMTIVDVPVGAETKPEAISQIRQHYDYLLNMKEDLDREGFATVFALHPLRHLPGTNLIDGEFIKHATPEQMNSDTLIGLFGMYEYLSEKLGIDLSAIRNAQCLNDPIVRYLKNGEIMNSDMHYVDREVLKKIGHM